MYCKLCKGYCTISQQAKLEEQVDSYPLPADSAQRNPTPSTPSRDSRSQPLHAITTPGTQTYRNVFNRSRADYSVYLVKDGTEKVMAVLIQTKLISSATFQHALAQVSPFVLS